MKKESKFFILYLLSFYLIWTARVIWILPILDLNNAIDPNIRAIAGSFIKIIIWIIPVFLYLKFIDRVNLWNYLKLNTNVRKSLKVSLLISIIWIILNLILDYSIGNKSIHFNLPLSDWLGGILFAGIAEEILFRGFFLQKLKVYFNFWPANICTGLLFLLVHIPGWLFLGTPITLPLIISIFIFSILWGILVKYTNSLSSSIIVHTVNNFISLTIFKL